MSPTKYRNMLKKIRNKGKMNSSLVLSLCDLGGDDDPDDEIMFYFQIQKLFFRLDVTGLRFRIICMYVIQILCS